LLNQGLFLDDALAIGGHQQGKRVGGGGLPKGSPQRDACPGSSMARPIPQQGSEPGSSLDVFQGRECEGLEVVEPVQAPAVHAALKPIQALLAAALPHRLKQQCLGIRAGTMGRWS